MEEVIKMQINSYYNNALQNQQMAMLRISTANRINSAKDDAAGLAISENLKSQYNGLNQASNNIAQTQDLLNTAEGGMNNSEDVLQRMRELSLQASNGTLNDSNRADIQAEMNQLKEQLDSNANATQFNGIYTNNGTLKNFATQTETDNDGTVSTSIGDMSSKGLGITGNVSTQSDALKTLDSIDKAISNLSSSRANVGAMTNRLDYSASNANQASSNMQSAYSNYKDADIARESTSYRQACAQVYASMMAMSMQMRGEANKLSILV